MAVAFALGEIAVAGSFFLLPFAGGAVGAAIVALLGGSVGFSWLVFLLVSAACAAVLRPLARRLDRSSPGSFQRRQPVGRPPGHGAARHPREAPATPG